jgi:polyferredoxin
MVGIALCVACIAVHSVSMAIVNRAAIGTARRTAPIKPRFRLILVMAATVSVLLIAHIIEVGLWSGAYKMLGAVTSRDDAFYFAFVNYTTLGYGDVLPEPRWRLLGPMAAMNGILLFGWSTAVIYDVLRNIAQNQPEANFVRKPTPNV